MSAEAPSALAALLEGERARGTFPSWSAVVAEGGRTLFEQSGGDAVVEPGQRTASPSTLYDLASLTKPLVTAVLVLRLAEEGLLPLDQPLARKMTEMTEPPRDRITVLDLLTHRSGLPAWAPLYLAVRKPVLAAYAAAAAKLPLESAPGERVRYSDLGYIVLGALLERIAGRPFAELARKHVLERLGEDDLLFQPRPEQLLRVAATERGNEYERQMAGGQEGDGRFRPGRILVGEVHDGNAAALGGVAPHAGLFGTARSVARAALEFLEPSSDPEPQRRMAGMLGPAGRRLAAMDLTGSTGSHRTACFELAANAASAAEGVLPAEAFGHTGFTGTSLWIEPRRGRVHVLLTNRVHPTVRDGNMNEVRRRFHAAAYRLTVPGRGED